MHTVFAHLETLSEGGGLAAASCHQEAGRWAAGQAGIG